MASRKAEIVLTVDATGAIAALDKTSGEMKTLDEIAEETEGSLVEVGQGATRGAQQAGDAAEEAAADVRQMAEASEQAARSTQSMAANSNRANQILFNTGDLVQDLQFGLRGAGNNIAFLAEGLAEMNARGGQSTSIIQQLTGALMGPAGAILALQTGIAVATAFSDKIVAAFQDGEQAAEDFRVKANEVTSSILEVQSAAGDLQATLSTEQARGLLEGLEQDQARLENLQSAMEQFVEVSGTAATVAPVELTREEFEALRSTIQEVEGLSVAEVMPPDVIEQIEAGAEAVALTKEEAIGVGEALNKVGITTESIQSDLDGTQGALETTQQQVEEIEARQRGIEAAQRQGVEFQEEQNDIRSRELETAQDVRKAYEDINAVIRRKEKAGIIGPTEAQEERVKEITDLLNRAAESEHEINLQAPTVQKLRQLRDQIEARLNAEPTTINLTPQLEKPDDLSLEPADIDFTPLTTQDLAPYREFQAELQRINRLRKDGAIGAEEAQQRTQQALEQTLVALSDVGEGSSEVFDELLQRLNILEASSTMTFERFARDAMFAARALDNLSEEELQQLEAALYQTKQATADNEESAQMAVQAFVQLGSAITAAFQQGQTEAERFRAVMSSILRVAGSLMMRIGGQSGNVGLMAAGGGLSILGGIVPGLSHGGMVRGPGGPTDDQVLRRLSDGEFVVNAESAREARPMLEAINQGPQQARRITGVIEEPPEINVTTRFDESAIVSAIDRLGDRISEMEQVVDVREVASKTSDYEAENDYIGVRG